MRSIRFGLAITIVWLTCSAALAADANAIFGKWIEKFPGGNGAITEFTPTAMHSYIVDANGKMLRDIGNVSVTYKSVGVDTIAVTIENDGGIMLVVKDAKTMVMEFPGVGAHLLTKVESE